MPSVTDVLDCNEALMDPLQHILALLVISGYELVTGGNEIETAGATLCDRKARGDGGCCETRRKVKCGVLKQRLDIQVLIRGIEQKNIVMCPCRLC